MTQVPAALDRPKWGAQASFVQPREPAFWLYVVLLAIGGYLFIQEESLFSRLSQSLILSWAIVLLYALPVGLIVYRLDLFEKEPKALLAAAVVWGGIVAVSLAGQANDHWLSVLAKVSPEIARDWGAAIVGPGVEETLKLMGVVTIFLIARNEFDGALDGFVYGAMVGLGFTVVEDVGYFMINAFQSISDPTAIDQTQPVVDVAVIRILGGGLYTHVLFTGITGMGFAYWATRTRESQSRRALALAAALAAGVLAHLVWNSPLLQTVLATDSGSPSTIQWIEYCTLKGAPFLILLGVLVALATRSEEKSFRAIVAGETAPEVILETELAALGSLLSRRKARTAAGLRGRQASLLVGRLQRAQVDYAMARSRTDSLDDPAVEAQRRRIREIRAQLAALPAAWAPTHVVPAGGMQAWPAPDPSQPAVALGERLELVVEDRLGDWAQVRAVNGWRGWVDGRRLVPRT